MSLLWTDTPLRTCKMNFAAVVHICEMALPVSNGFHFHGQLHFCKPKPLLNQALYVIWQPGDKCMSFYSNPFFFV